jgi:hypothetical protein
MIKQILFSHLSIVIFNIIMLIITLYNMFYKVKKILVNISFIIRFNDTLNNSRQIFEIMLQ